MSQSFEAPEEARYDAASQQRIIELAAEMQREEAASLSRSEIEMAAAEAGIDPKFVRRAIEYLERTSLPAPLTGPPLMLQVILGAFVMANVYGVSTVLRGEPSGLYFAFGFGLVAGMVLSRTARERFLTLGVGLISSLLVLAWCNFAWQYGEPLPINYFRNFVAVQMVSVLMGQGFGALVRWLNRPKGVPTPARDV